MLLSHDSFLEKMENVKKLPRTCFSKMEQNKSSCVAESTNKQVPSKAQNGLCKPKMCSQPNLSQRKVLGQQISQYHTVFFPNLLSTSVLEGHLSRLWGTLLLLPSVENSPDRPGSEQTHWSLTRHYCKAAPWKNTNRPVPSTAATNKSCNDTEAPNASPNAPAAKPPSDRTGNTGAAEAVTTLSWQDGCVDRSVG